MGRNVQAHASTAFGSWGNRLEIWFLLLSLVSRRSLSSNADLGLGVASHRVQPRNDGSSSAGERRSEYNATEFQRLHGLAEQAMIKGDVAVAGVHFATACKMRRAVNLDADTGSDHPLMRAGDGSFLRAGRLKLRHDAEQLEYLVEQKMLPSSYSSAAKVFRHVLQQLPQNIHAVDIRPGGHRLFDRLHSRALHLVQPGRMPDGVLHPSFDGPAFEKRFREAELEPEVDGCEAQNGISFADGVLSDSALEALHQWCLESTMWFSSRAGYVASFMQEAFNSPLIVQVAEELRQALPTIVGNHNLMNMWAFKYSNNESDWPLAGTAVHADVAAVNVNMWITEDAANEDAEGGGLIIYKKHAPKTWGFEDYNSLDQVPHIQAFLNNSDRIIVPHRRNRVVMFNSNLFHETQIPRFQPGYKNRRINLTFLFGRRCGGVANEQQRSTRRVTDTGNQGQRGTAKNKKRIKHKGPKDDL